MLFTHKIIFRCLSLCTASENISYIISIIQSYPCIYSNELERANSYFPGQPKTTAMAAGPHVTSVPSSSTRLTGKLGEIYSCNALWARGREGVIT